MIQKILLAVAGSIALFFFLVVLFSVAFIFGGEDDLTERAEEGVPTVPEIELLRVAQERDSLLTEMQGLMDQLVNRENAIDSINRVAQISDARVDVLEDNLEQRDADIINLREVEVNAVDMAKTFQTMTIEELTPIIVRLSDDVVLDIYKNTSSKRRKYLLAALGTARAAAMTNRLISKEGS